MYKKIGITSLLSWLVLTGCSSTPIQSIQQPVATGTVSATTRNSAQLITSPQAQTPTRSTTTQIATPAKAQTPALSRASLSTSTQAKPAQVSAPLAAQSNNVIASNQSPEVNIAKNYSTQTLLVGLKSDADLPQAKALVAQLNLDIERYIKGIHALVLKTRGQEVTSLVKDLAQESLFAFVETDHVASQKPEEEKEVTDSFKLFAADIVNDKYFKDQYALTNMQVPEAWSYSRGEGTVIAVIDTGVSLSHADLKNRVVPGYDALSLREGGTTGDVSSLNYVFSTYKHGSHVAGIIAAEANNGQGIAGVAPEAKIMPIKIYPDVADIISSILAPDPDANQTIISVLADGVVWAADHGANVINMSLSVSAQSATLERAVKYALDKNVSVVVAAGNDRQAANARNYLAAIEGVIGVGATDINNNVTVFSNSGDYVSVAAPGLDIISTVPSFLRFRPYVKMSGTSMAAPQVAGLAALLRSKFGEIATPAWIKQRLENTALDRGAPGRDDLYGHGLVNALKALTAPL
jgi:type VII secretion-associated serine protease mycosin